MYRVPGESVSAEVPAAPGPAAAAAPAARAPSSSDSPLVGFLVSFSVDPNGISWPLRFGRTRIGGGLDQDVMLPQDGVSGSHAEIMVRANPETGKPKIWVTDQNSTNGTQLNGADIFTDRPDLAHGDIVGISNVELMVILLPTME